MRGQKIQSLKLWAQVCEFCINCFHTSFIRQHFIRFSFILQRYLFGTLLMVTPRSKQSGGKEGCSGEFYAKSSRMDANN